ncbi:lamin tail domain-containing protein, partial [Akkermansiaceae bacterium]|nr:lamin tail domain-containing protein [Akkermansiaceae bacterium]
MKKTLLFLALVQSLNASDSVVTFNEINYNPQGASEDLEWIEVHNQMAINVDFSGWKITGGVNFTIPEGTIIPGGGYFLIARDPSNPALADLDVAGPFTGSLANGGETIRLRSRSERLMDELDYSDSGQWPVGPDGSGATLAKIENSL